MITKKYYKLIRVSHEDSAYLRIKNISNEGGVFKIAKSGSFTDSKNLEYSLDGITWTTYDFTTLPEVAVAAGANIYFRGTNNKGFQWISYDNNTDHYIFDFNKNYIVAGNILSLRNPDPLVFETLSVLSGKEDCCFLFENQTHLISAENLNFGVTTNIATSGYMKAGLGYLFSGCTSLTTAPDFSNITTVGPNGLKNCFTGCTSLTTAPDFSNITTVDFQSFSSCFMGCTSLTTAPDFSNITTVNQTHSFAQCFTNCSHLGDVTAPNISNLTANNVLQNWLVGAGTQATGTKVVRVPTGATIATDSIGGIPTDWTRVDY